MSRRISRAARRYLLTGQPEPSSYGIRLPGSLFAGGRWALEYPGDACPVVSFFSTPESRDAWVDENSAKRRAVGKRNRFVKVFRLRMARRPW